MNVVAINESNWEELKAIRLKSLKESPEAFSASYSVVLNFSEEEWRSRASGSSGGKFFIAKKGLESVGIIGGFYKTGEYELVSMWVSPIERGRGIAKLLIHSVAQHAKQLGYNSIFLEVKSENIAAFKLYEKVGFKLVSTSSSSSNEIPASLNKMQLNLNA